MKTLAEILPDTHRRVRQRYARMLQDAGIVEPAKQAKGMPSLYHDDHANKIESFANLVQGDGLTLGESLARMTTTATDSSRTHDLDESHPRRAEVAPATDASRTDSHLEINQEAGETISNPANELRKELEELKNRLDQESQARTQLTNKLEEESAARNQEQQEAKTQANSLTEQIRDLDEERKNQRARIGSLETTIKKGKPKSLWERIKLAFGVITGTNAAVPALPESISSAAREKAA